MTTTEQELNDFLWRRLEGLQENLVPVILLVALAIFCWVARVRLIERTRRRVKAAAEAYAARELSLE